MVVKLNSVLAIGYIRQSDERDDKEDISEKTQLLKIEQYCALNGFTLVNTFKDIDYSGFRIPYTKRPGIMEAFQYLKENPLVKKFIIFNLSRLTRLKKDFGKIQSLLNRAEVDICSASEQLDFGSATGRLVAGILVDFNEYYSDNLSDVTNDTKTTNAEKGRWNGGPAPFGLIRTSDGFKLDNENQRAWYMSNAFEMAKEGKGTLVIASWLNTEGVLTETGKPWTPRRIRYVLTNPTYAAMQRWKGKYYQLNNCPTIVSWQDFLYIQSTRFSNDNTWKGRQNRQLLSSVLRCPICGSKMHSRLTGKSVSRRYVCNNLNIYGKYTCAGRRIDTETLNQAVISLVADMAQKRYTKEQLISERVHDSNEEESAGKRLQLERDNLEVAKQRVFDDFYLNNKFSEEQFNALMSRYEKRQNEIEQLLKKIPLPISKGYGDYDDMVSEFGAALEYLPEEDKRRTVELLIDKIIPGFPTQVFFKWGEMKEIEPSPSRKYNGRVMFF